MQKTFGVWLSLARAPGLGPGGRRFESCHPDYMRVQFNGRTPAFQAGYVGSIPITRLDIAVFAVSHMCLQLSWIEHRPSKPGVGGSNPFRHIFYFISIPYGPYEVNMVGIAQLVSAPDCGSGGPGFESLYPPCCDCFYSIYIATKCRAHYMRIRAAHEYYSWAIAKR